MSSLAAASADNYYQPPEWDPQRESRNAFQARGKAKWQAHPLRERAKKLHTEGILVTRFEMPFDVWCGGCATHIAKGVRFNADKKRAGNYLTTAIWSFRMKCHLCPCEIEIRTNPQAGDFDVAEGARRKEERYTEADAEVERLDTPEDRARRAADPFCALEHKQGSLQKARAAEHWLTALQSDRDQRGGHGNDYSLSSAMRKRFREDKRESRLTQLELRARGIGIVDRLPALSAEDLASTQRLCSSRGAHPMDKPKRRCVEADCLMPEARLRIGGIFEGTPGHAQSAGTEHRLRLLHKRKASGMKIRTH